MSVVGDNILRIRREKGVSQNKLGRALGYTNGSYISAIEHGSKHPKDDLLGRIAEILDVKVDDLRKRSNLGLQSSP